MKIIALTGIGLLILLAVAIIIPGLRAAHVERTEPPAPLDWEPEELAEIRTEANVNPLEDRLDAFDLVPALWLEDLAAKKPVQLDWQPASFTQEWSRIDLDRQLGETQSIPAVS